MAKKIKYRSKFEKGIADQITKAKIPYEYEGTRLPYSILHWYTTDFELYGKDKKFFIETKGRFTSKDRTKMLAVKAAFPNDDFRMVFMRDNYLYKGSKTKYSDWCKKNGFKYAVGHVPKSWIKEAKGA